MGAAASYIELMALILRETDLKPLYSDPSSMDGLLEMIEDSLRAHISGKVPHQVRFQMPLVDPKRELRFMTATVPGAGEGVRVTPLFRGGRDAHFSLFFDGHCGDLLALVAGGELNVWRTGAPTGVASRVLAQPGAKLLALLGSGRQAKGQLLAIRRALPSLEEVRVFSPTEKHRTRFAKEMTSWLGIQVEPVDNARAAIQGAQIVSLATSSRKPVIESDWISPGMLVSSITSGQLPQDLVARSRVIVSWKEEVLEGKPPRQPYASMIASGNWSADRIAAELGEVVLGNLPARLSERDILLFESVGMPVWDTAATSWAYRWALQHKAGTSFSLA